MTFGNVFSPPSFPRRFFSLLIKFDDSSFHTEEKMERERVKAMWYSLISPSNHVQKKRKTNESTNKSGHNKSNEQQVNLPTSHFRERENLSCSLFLLEFSLSLCLSNRKMCMLSVCIDNGTVKMIDRSLI